MHLSLPLMLWVEPSAVCNLSCPGCPTADGRGAGIMSLADFTRLLDIIPRTVRILNLWHRGEPLCSPNFSEMVALTTQRGLWTQTYSNGTLINRDNTAQLLVKAGLKRITLAVDSADQATYQQYREGGKLADVIEGIRRLRVERQRAAVRHPRIVVECLLRRQTQDQLQNVYRLARSWGADEVKFKTYRLSNLNDSAAGLKELPDDQRWWRYKLIDGQFVMLRKRDGCRRLAYSAVVAYDGEFFPCCFWTKPFGLGNIFKQSWRSIWHDALSEFRSIVNSGSRDSIPMCRNCTEGLKRLYVKIV